MSRAGSQSTGSCIASGSSVPVPPEMMLQKWAYEWAFVDLDGGLRRGLAGGSNWLRRATPRSVSGLGNTQCMSESRNRPR